MPHEKKSIVVKSGDLDGQSIELILSIHLPENNRLNYPLSAGVNIWHCHYFLDTFHLLISKICDQDIKLIFPNN